MYRACSLGILQKKCRSTGKKALAYRGKAGQNADTAFLALRLGVVFSTFQLTSNPCFFGGKTQGNPDKKKTRVVYPFRSPKILGKERKRKKTRMFCCKEIERKIENSKDWRVRVANHILRAPRSRNLAIANFDRRPEIAAISGTRLSKETLRFKAANLHRQRLAAGCDFILRISSENRALFRAAKRGGFNEGVS